MQRIEKKVIGSQNIQLVVNPKFPLPEGFTILSKRTSFSKHDNICKKLKCALNITGPGQKYSGPRGKDLLITHLLMECDSTKEKREELLKSLKITGSLTISGYYHQLRGHLNSYSPNTNVLVDFLSHHKIDKILNL